MIGQGVGKAADDGVVLGTLGQFRKVLTNLDSGNRGWYRLELAAIFRRRIRLEIEGVLMRRPTLKKNKNAGPFLRWLLGAGL